MFHCTNALELVAAMSVMPDLFTRKFRIKRLKELHDEMEVCVQRSDEMEFNSVTSGKEHQLIQLQGLSKCFEAFFLPHLLNVQFPNVIELEIAVRKRDNMVII